MGEGIVVEAGREEQGYEWGGDAGGGLQDLWVKAVMKLGCLADNTKKGKMKETAGRSERRGGDKMMEK